MSLLIIFVDKASRDQIFAAKIFLFIYNIVYTNSMDWYKPIKDIIEKKYSNKDDKLNNN